MKALVQRVISASVVVEGETIGSINQGLVVLLGVERHDTQAHADWLVDKVLGLRIFADADKPMNRSVMDIDGELLVVSQFTLAADTSRGKRPSFTTAAAPDVACALYDYFSGVARQHVRVATGRFGADMQVSLVNDGPVTFMLEK